MKRLIACGLAMAAAVALAVSAGAQAGSFEVASIKPSNPNPTGPLGAAPFVLPALGRLTAQNITLRMLVMAAYQKQPFEIVGGPEWQNSDKFDINAKAAETSPTTDQLLGMLQTLLADRFKLKVHTESRELPVFDLVVARSDGRLGPDLRSSKSDCSRAAELVAEQSAAIAGGDLTRALGTPGPCTVTTDVSGGVTNLMMRGDGQEMRQLVEVLSQLTGRTVRDKTGLTGRYDFALRMDLQAVLALAQRMGATIPAAAANIPQSDGSSLMTALNEQLGLKLESTRGAITVVVIDSVEAPAPD